MLLSSVFYCICTVPRKILRPYVTLSCLGCGDRRIVIPGIVHCSNGLRKLVALYWSDRYENRSFSATFSKENSRIDQKQDTQAEWNEPSESERTSAEFKNTASIHPNIGTVRNVVYSDVWLTLAILSIFWFITSLREKGVSPLSPLDCTYSTPTIDLWKSFQLPLILE